jgi:hypothetical protein
MRSGKDCKAAWVDVSAKEIIQLRAIAEAII